MSQPDNGTRERVADAVDAAAPADAARMITALAGGLWLVVGSLLVYGITMTSIKAAALFTG